jgi:hypothetical protein
MVLKKEYFISNYLEKVIYLFPSALASFTTDSNLLYVLRLRIRSMSLDDTPGI